MRYMFYMLYPVLPIRRRMLLYFPFLQSNTRRMIPEPLNN